jgi:predicted nucleic acid-binding protein
MNEPEVVVLDASIAIAHVLPEPASAAAQDRLVAWAQAGTRLAVPSLLWLEVVNVLGRRARLSGAAVLEAVHLLDGLDLETHEIDPPLLVLTIEHAERHGLTAYDAVYLALAERLDAALASNDRRLLAAAGRRGLQIGEAATRRLGEVPAAYVATRPSWPDYRGAGAFLAALRADARRELEVARR